MPTLNSLAKFAIKPIPRMLSPKTHSTADYMIIGSFLAGAGLFWQRSKRAALASLICGAAELAVSLLTDYPGGVKKMICFRARRHIDLGLASMTANYAGISCVQRRTRKEVFPDSRSGDHRHYGAYPISRAAPARKERGKEFESSLKVPCPHYGSLAVSRR